MSFLFTDRLEITNLVSVWRMNGRKKEMITTMERSFAYEYCNYRRKRENGHQI